MSVVSGVISRQVLPACGSLCFFCPAMRARSRQPVKRYKKLIADIFPRNQVSVFRLSLFYMFLVLIVIIEEDLMCLKGMGLLGVLLFGRPHGSLLIDVFKTGIHPLSMY